jgi:perosamine synthetase
MSLSSPLPAILEALASVTRVDGPHPLHTPAFEGNEWAYVKECLDTGWVSSAGSYVDQFERSLESFTGVDHAVAVVNGTAALHVALRCSGVQAGDEVLVPALTFVATANAVSYCGAIPHFVDSSRTTLGVDPHRLRAYLDEIAVRERGVTINKKTRRPIRAVLAMHTFGHPVDLDPLVDVCQTYDLELVEDAAEALGSFYRDRHVGGAGRVSTLSFNGNKIITTGGGGAILTNDEALAEEMRHLTTTAKAPHRWDYWHDKVGYNYRLPNINAALGCAQIEQMPSFLERKRDLAYRYIDAFEQVEGVSVFEEPSFAKSNYWLNAILLDDDYASFRDDLLDRSHDAGYLTRPVWRLMASLPMYEACPSMDLPVASSIARRLINLPSSSTLTPHHVDA